MKRVAVDRDVMQTSFNPVILHWMPSSAIDPSLKYLGSTKDIRCRTEYFQSRDFKVVEVYSNRDLASLKETLSKLSPECDFKSFTHVLLDMPGSHGYLVRELKRYFPGARICLRAHNAEFFHRIDWAMADRSYTNRWQGLKRALKGLVKDIVSVREANFVFCICESDATSYWARLVKIFNPNCVVQVVPYYITSDFLDGCDPQAAKENICVNVGAPDGVSSISEDQYENFVMGAEGLSKESKWNFLVMGDPPLAHQVLSNISFTGRVKNPFQVLNKARVVSVLTDLGRGFKTKILEALSAGCYVLVGCRLYERLPKEILKYCIPIDLKKLKTEPCIQFQLAMDLVSELPRIVDPNAEFKKKAIQEMDRCFQNR